LSSTNRAEVLLNLLPTEPQMITLTSVNLPFIINKEKTKDEKQEGMFALYFYSRKIMHHNQLRYKFEPLRFDGKQARFKSRKDAKEYARHRLALD
jgi:hypothetical protein